MKYVGEASSLCLTHRMCYINASHYLVGRAEGYYLQTREMAAKE